MTTLTEMEKDVLENGIINNSQFPTCPWSWAIADDCKVCRKDQVCGVISSLVKKGLIHSAGRGENSHVSLTIEGQKYHEGMEGE